MVVALLILSLAMIVGGLLAMALGWDIVLLERGWAMVIAGSVSASGGAILLGLVAVLSRLGRMQAELGAGRDRAHEAMPIPPSPVIDPVSILSAGLLTDGKAPEAPANDKDASTLPLFEPGKGKGPQAPAAAGERSSERSGTATEDEFASHVADDDSLPAVPEDLFADAKTADEDDELPDSARPEWARGAGAEPPKPDWARDKADEPAPASKPEPGPNSSSSGNAPRSAVIGTYNSGGNRYVMFADGSIEAETPDGSFKFASLDELKEFIASGGESSGTTR